MSDGCGGDAKGGAVMNGVKPGERVGVIHDKGILYGIAGRETVSHGLEIYGKENSFYDYVPPMRSFPMWKGNYTRKDALELAEMLRDCDYDELANNVRNFHRLTGSYISLVLQEMINTKEILAENIGEEMESVKMIDKFIDWANHGFQSWVEQ